MIDDYRKVKYHGYTFICSKQAHYGLYLHKILDSRLARKQATNITFTGEAGVSKSYTAITVARIQEGFKKSNKLKGDQIVRREIMIGGKKKRVPIDKFGVDQIVFDQSSYMKELGRKRMGKIIVYDEPSYSMGKRDFYKDLQKALIKTLESQRFMIRPLFLPIINMSLLDKTIRSHLIQFQINLTARGEGKVYRLSNSPFKDETRYNTVCEVSYADYDHLRCGFDSCLGCKFLGSLEDSEHKCDLLSAQYERKKLHIQLIRYDQARSQAEEKESSEWTDEQIEKLCMDNLSKFLIVSPDEEKKIHVQKLRLFLRDKRIKVSRSKAYSIKSNLEIMYPNATT